MRENLDSVNAWSRGSVSSRLGRAARGRQKHGRKGLGVAWGSDYRGGMSQPEGSA